MSEGELALVLHTHMPYVEGFGTWPFGEEWLWEAIATSYLPLLDILADAPALTVSVTPVLGDQLEVANLAERFTAFVAGVRSQTHELDIAAHRARGEHALAAELERSWEDYREAPARLEGLRGGLLGALAPRAAWTSAATHAILPLLASDAGVRLQLQAGIESHRERFGDWHGGLWLPECAYAPWLEPLLAEAGVHAVCVELDRVWGRGDRRHLQPLARSDGLLLVPLDRATIELVWSGEGYPCHPVYRDYHAHSAHHHRPWCNAGTPYDRSAAAEQVRADAADFVARVRERVAGGGLCVCALDTELLGHWWYEGVAWLGEVVAEAARQGLPLAHLDDAASRHAVASAEELPACSWGRGRDLRTWSGPAVADMAFAARAGELELLAAAPAPGATALRELLALQGSDWTFAVSEDLAPSYGRERAAEHLRRLRAALRGPGDPAALRNLAAGVGRRGGAGR